MNSVSDAITNLQNMTAYNRSQQEKTYSSSISSNEFLYLLTQQLQYQDPMNPMDNSQMLAQEAQFSTLEQLESLTGSFSQFANVYQANSLMGQTIEIKDGESTVKGTVDYVDMTDAKGASVSVNGKLYPLTNVTKVYPKNTAESAAKDEEDRNFLLGSLYYIGESIGNISEKLTSYLGGGAITPNTDTTAAEE